MEVKMIFVEALMKMRECDSALALCDLIWLLSISIYIRKLAALERKLSEHVTWIVALGEMFESFHYSWSGCWYVHKCLQVPHYLTEHRIHSSQCKRSWPLISEVLTGVFLLSQRKPLKIFVLFLFLFPQETAPFTAAFFFFKVISCPDNIFQAPKIFVSHHYDAHKWASVTVTPDYTSSAYSLQFVCNWKHSCLPASLQFAALA